MEVKLHILIGLIALGAMPGLFATGASEAQSSPSPLFPFAPPWDDATVSGTNISSWIPRPAGKLGRVHVGPDGRLYTGKERIRFFGVNLCGGACFPRREDAGRIAARMAKFGINSVRFHHMDSQWSPLIDYQKGNSRQLSSESLSRLDNFVAELKRNGIYADLNLLVSRAFMAADGLPPEIDPLDWKDRHVVGFFYAPVLDLQKEYARDLLTHRNPFTNLTYAEDPGVAIVEINNENGLIHAWLGGQVDRLPEIFLRDLQRQWSEWLRKRYGATAKLREVWGVKEEPLGEECLTNAGFSKSLEGWVLEQHEGAEAKAVIKEEKPQGLDSKPVCVTVTKAGKQGWHVQFNQTRLKVKASHPYTLVFRAKADRPCEISVNVGQAHDPWQSLGFGATTKLTTEWQQFHYTFTLKQSDDNARVNFSDLARQTGAYWFAGLSLRPGGIAGLAGDERLEESTVPVLSRSRFEERTPEAQRDWMRFLWETEDSYWQSMYRYLKDDLKVKSLVMGTIVGCSTPNLMARLDCVDTHAYWQHPIFTGRPWDPEHWLVPNRTMVNERGGTLPWLALRRVLGKPHFVTEYNHPAPNTYSSEAFLLLCACASLQDWDAVYAFSYSHRADEWDQRRIPNFFDIDQHPTKMVTLVPAVAMFVRGDVKGAKQQVAVSLKKEEEIDILKSSGAWDLVHAGRLGVAGEAALVHRVAIATEGRPLNPSSSAGQQPEPTVSRFVSDTDEVAWDVSEMRRGVVTVNAAKSKAIIGYGRGKRFNLGGVVIEPGDTRQDGWSALTVTVMDGELRGRRSTRLPRKARLLITATGFAENTDMGWKNPERSSVGKDWGKSPSLVEGIPARVTLPLPASEVQAFALDERGQRRSPLTVEAGAEGTAVIVLTPEARTLWYEVVTK